MDDTVKTMMWVVVMVVIAVGLPTTSAQDFVYTTPNPSIWSVEDYPDPRWDYAKCGRDNTSKVCDPNGLITKIEANELDRLINDVLKKTRCTCIQCLESKRGYEIRVAIMAEMEPVYNMSSTIQNNLHNARVYSWLLSNKYKLTGVCNETLLILYAKNNGILYTLTRKQARAGLPDNDVVAITEDNRKYFDDPTTVGKGLSEMIKQYRYVLLGNTYERPVVAEFTGGAGNGGNSAVSPSRLLACVLVIYTLTFKYMNV